MDTLRVKGYLHPGTDIGLPWRIARKTFETAILDRYDKQIAASTYGHLLAEKQMQAMVDCVNAMHAVFATPTKLNEGETM